MLQAGQLCRLKSGGPIMTVSVVDEDGTIACKWFVGTRLEQSRFQEASLEPCGQPLRSVPV